MTARTPPESATCFRPPTPASRITSSINTLGGPWAQGLLADKVYSGFTATSTAPAHHVDGNPYSTSHVSGQNDIPVDDAARNSAAFQGRRVETMAARLLAIPVG